MIIADISKPAHIPDKATFIKTDVTSWASQLELFQKAVELHNRIDIICANAGISEDKEAFQDKVDEYGVPLEPRWNTIHVNLIGVSISTKLAIHFLKMYGGGKIILTSSLSGTFVIGTRTFPTLLIPDANRVRCKWPSDVFGFQTRRKCFLIPVGPDK